MFAGGGYVALGLVVEAVLDERTEFEGVCEEKEEVLREGHCGMIDGQRSEHSEW